MLGFITTFLRSVMDKFISAAEANRQFSALLREVRKGRQYVVTSHGRPIARNKKRGLGKPEIFNFLGFTHICGVSRRGRFLIHRKTRRDRLQAKPRVLCQEMKKRLHQPVRATGLSYGFGVSFKAA